VAERQVVPRAPGRALVARAIVAALSWWVLTEGNLSSPLLALAVIVAAVAGSFLALPAGRTKVNVLGALMFGAWFLRQSVLGGVDVALRAFKPRLPLHPGLVTVSVKPGSDFAHAVLAAVVCLVPGTLGARFEEGELVVHALDARQPIAARVSEIERRLRAVLPE
jgi:multicomponent Na+:H+ antiporter subunit E